MPDGTSYITISRTLEGPQAGFGERVRRTALMIVTETAHAKDIVYGEALSASTSAVAIGPSCRLCERQGCLSRAEAPLTRPLGLDEMVTGLSVFDFQ
jgi:predicted transcriptional regulator